MLECVEGGPLRFSVAASGQVTFGDDRRTFDGGLEGVPLAVRAAARNVREALDLDALRAATADPSEVTFFGIATRRERVDYDWERLPPFLGTDVWSSARGAYLSPDDVEYAFERLGLASANTVERERPAVHFDLTAYDFPVSNWYEGPVAGLRFRDKTGGRARSRNAGLPQRPDPTDISPEAFAAQFVTDERVRQAALQLEEDRRAATVDAVCERVLEAVVREEYARLYRDDDLVVNRRALRSAVCECIQRALG